MTKTSKSRFCGLSLSKVLSGQFSLHSAVDQKCDCTYKECASHHSVSTRAAVCLSQALPLLREVLPEECEDRLYIQSNEPSYSSPLIPNDGGEIKQAKHAPWLTRMGEQEVTSWCEDESKEESTVEKIPITDWDSGSNSSKAKASQEMHLETGNARSPPFSRTETRKRMVTAIKSKAFWGESDDSSSEIEAALRPQTHSTEADDFDDFYD